MTQAWEARKDFLQVEKQNQMPKMKEVCFQESSVRTQTLWSKARGQCAAWEGGKRVELS